MTNKELELMQKTTAILGQETKCMPLNDIIEKLVELIESGK
jgi:hypothetical protein